MNTSSLSTRRDMWRVLRIIFRIFWWSWITGVAAVILVIANCLLHVLPGVCPLHCKVIRDAELVPVIYGLPAGRTLDRAERGEVVLGGCVVRPVDAVCPYCHWPARWK